MPTSTEALKQYVPHELRYQIAQYPNLEDADATQSTPPPIVKTIDLKPVDVKPVDVEPVDVKSTDLNELITVPTRGSSKLKVVLIVLGIIAALLIVATVITLSVVLTKTTTKTTTTTIFTTISTSTLNTTTQPSYPNGIYLLTPGNPLLNISNPSSSSPYYNVSWLYYAQAYNETLTFAIQNNPSYTQIDDVSVLYGTQQLLCNGDFEYGNMNCWQGANHLSTSNPHNGTYCYNDGVVGAPDYVWQTFNTTPGALLYISFWITWGGSGGGVYTNVSIYP